MDQADLLRHAPGVLESQGVIYALVGSYASAVYGEPRFTHDIDIVVQLTLQDANQLCGCISGAGVLCRAKPRPAKQSRNTANST